jgi:hypothetical protein
MPIAGKLLCHTSYCFSELFWWYGFNWNPTRASMGRNSVNVTSFVNWIRMETVRFQHLLSLAQALLPFPFGTRHKIYVGIYEIYSG